MCDNPTVIIVGRQAGTANAFLPLIHALKQRACSMTLIGFSTAAALWEANGLSVTTGATFEETLPALDQLQNPGFMLTGTSSMAEEDARFWGWAAQHNVPSLAFVDHWVNYWQRFSSDPVGANRFDLMPEKIAVIDDIAAMQMQKAGCPPGKLLVTGHPAFDNLYRTPPPMDEEMRLMIMPQAYDFMALFVSEPLSQAYGIETKNILGYTEKTVLELVFAALNRLGEKLEKRFCLALKLHPSEDRSPMADLLESQQNQRWVVSTLVDGDRHRLIAASDVVVGMTSLLLYEATLMGRPVVSLQPNRKQTNDLTDLHSGIILATDPRQIQAALREALLARDKAVVTHSPGSARQATECFLSYIFAQAGLKDTAQS